MNVLFYSWEYPPLGAGVGAYVSHMAMALAENGHRVTVLTGAPNGVPCEMREGGVRVLRRYGRRDVNTPRAVSIVRDAIEEVRPDFVEGCDHLGECAGLLRSGSPVPVMVKAHACQVVRVLQRAHLHYPWQRATWALARLRSWRQMRDELYSITHANLLASPSARLLRELRAQGLRLPARQGVLPNPIADPGAGRAEAERPTLLFVGRIEFLKGIAFLPDLVRRVRARFPSTILEIAGDDSYARGIGSLRGWLTRRLGDNRESVRFLGRLTARELDAAYRRAWVTLVPSLWDNFPTVVLESMVRGTCVVTTPHGGMPEMLEGTGVAVHDPYSPAYGETLLHYLEDADARAAAGAALRGRCLSAYGTRTVVQAYVDFVGKNL